MAEQDFKADYFIDLAAGIRIPLMEHQLKDGWEEDLDIVEMVHLPLATYISLMNLATAAINYIAEEGDYSTLGDAAADVIDAIEYLPELQPRAKMAAS